MGIIVKNTSTWEAPPPDIHVGVCVDIVDIGIVEGEYQGKPTKRDMCRLVFELDPETAGLTSKDKRFYISRRYTKSLAERAALRADLESWRGRAFTPDELAGFDLDAILDKPARVVVEQKGDFTNLTKLLPAPKNCGFHQCGEYERVQDRPMNGEEGPPPNGSGGGYGAPLREPDEVDVPF